MKIEPRDVSNGVKFSESVIKSAQSESEGTALIGAAVAFVRIARHMRIHKPHFMQLIEQIDNSMNAKDNDHELAAQSAMSRLWTP